jgi:PucR family transcriptional regulator, purine catabolism regulatory protein
LDLTSKRSACKPPCAPIGLAGGSKGVPTVEDIVSLPELGIELCAGADALNREVSWLHVSELQDPTPWLEGRELLLTTGLGIRETPFDQRAYLARLAAHGLAGLGFGLGFGFAEVPPALVEEADRLGFPVLSIPYETPFVAITKEAYRRIAAEQLDRVTRALEVHERLAEAFLRGRALGALLGILSGHLRCTVALVDENGRLIEERRAGRRASLAAALELPVVARDVSAVLRVARSGDGGFSEYDRLVLHHGQTAVALELSRRRAVSAAELRLAGDLLDDLERERLDDREASRRMAAFGLDPNREHAALVAAAGDSGGGERLRHVLAAELERRSVRHVSAGRSDEAVFLIEAAGEDPALALARSLVGAAEGGRLGVGRPARGRLLGRSLREARAALATGDASVASYRDLGSLALLLNLSDAALEAFADRVLGPARTHVKLLTSLRELLETGCRWNETAARLGIHRHTLRYRIDRLAQLTGRHPDNPAQRMELWLALQAAEALAARAEHP